MQFLSADFILPFIGLLWVVPHISGVRMRQAVLLAFSLYFIWIATGGQNLAVMVVFVLTGYLLQRFVTGQRSRLAAGLLALLGVFFFLHNFNWSKVGISDLGNPATFGVAFMLARTIHVLVDQAQLKDADRIGALDYFAFCLSFLTFLSGPLQRYEDYQDNIRTWPPPTGAKRWPGCFGF